MSQTPEQQTTDRWARQHGTRGFVVDTHYVVHSPLGMETTPLPLLVVLHGQGMDAEQLGRIFAPLNSPRFDSSPHRLLIPQGPYAFEKRKPDGIRIGYGWYLYRGDQAEFHAHLVRSEQHLLGVVDQVESDFPTLAGRTTLFGFSQGGYLAGFVALRNVDRFGGLVLASTRFKHEFLSDELQQSKLPTTLAVHSTKDPALPWGTAQQSLQYLSQAGADVEHFLHDAGHYIPSSAVEHIGEWLQRKGFDAETRP